MNNPTPDPIRPIAPLLEDPEVTEVMIDGWQRVTIEKRGRLQDVSSPFHNDAEVYDLIRSIAGSQGKVVDESSPYVGRGDRRLVPAHLD